MTGLGLNLGLGLSRWSAGGGWTPASLGSKLKIWYDATVAASLFQDSAGTTPAAADNARVGMWKDLSGNAYHLLNAGTTTRPLLKLATQNGKNTVRSTQANAGFLATAATVASYAQPLTIFMAAAFDASPPGATNRAFDSTARVLGGTDTGPVYEVYAGGSVVEAGVPDGAFHTSSWDFQNGPAVMKLDGATVLSGSAGTAALATQLFLFNDPSLGAAAAAQMNIGEWFMGTALAAADIAAAVAYLKAKWGTP